MDRLSSYAAREAEEEEERTPEEQADAEDKATANLMERLRLSKESVDEIRSESEHANDNAPTTDDQSEAQTLVDDANPSRTESVNGEKPRAIPTDVKLFEIFHEQVMNLVSMQRLAIQDITALLVSLGNLSLYVARGSMLSRLC